MASKKKLKAKDDYPELGLTNSIVQLKHNHYQLCCFSCAFHKSGLIIDAPKTNNSTAKHSMAINQEKIGADLSSD